MSRHRGRVESVNLGTVRLVPWGGRAVRTAIYKTPALGAVSLNGENFAGDVQADRRVHGGEDKAVYAYAAGDYDWWMEQLGEPLAPGTFGDNLTVSGLDVTGALVGERWRVGTAVLAVTQPRVPCFKLGIRMGDDRFPRRFSRAGRPGAYLRIERPGEVSAGDAIEVLERPSHGVTVGLVDRAYHADHRLAGRLRDLPDLPEDWRRWADTIAAASGTRERQPRGRS